jgi:hypothetical protein
MIITAAGACEEDRDAPVEAGALAHVARHATAEPAPPAQGRDDRDDLDPGGGSPASSMVEPANGAGAHPQPGPVAIGDAATVAQDSDATAIDVLANDRDPGGRPHLVASVTQPRHGRAAVARDRAFVTYTPAHGYCNQAPNAPRDTFSYTVFPGGGSATVDVLVTCACGEHRATDFVVEDDR